jgi:hypothetical protein
VPGYGREGVLLRCGLVNKLWYAEAMPILWSTPGTWGMFMESTRPDSSGHRIAFAVPILRQLCPESRLSHYGLGVPAAECGGTLWARFPEDDQSRTNLG